MGCKTIFSSYGRSRAKVNLAIGVLFIIRGARFRANPPSHLAQRVRSLFWRSNAPIWLPWSRYVLPARTTSTRDGNDRSRYQMYVCFVVSRSYARGRWTRLLGLAHRWAGGSLKNDLRCSPRSHSMSIRPKSILNKRQAGLESERVGLGGSILRASSKASLKEVLCLRT